YLVPSRWGVFSRSARRGRLASIDHRLLLFVRKSALMGDFLALFLARRHNCRDRFARETDEIFRQRRLADRLVAELVQHRRDFLHALEVGGRYHRHAFWRINACQFARSDRPPHQASPPAPLNIPPTYP